MSTGRGRYDAELQMFIEQPREPDVARLQFLRWLTENGRLEHDVAGASGGEYARRLVEDEALAA